MSRLYVRQDGEEQILEIDGDLVTFGRSSENTIQVRDIKSSRRHCQIENTPAGFKLVDLESANGTSVNGAKVNHWMLQPGDVIAIGAVEIQFGEKPPALVAPPVPGSDPEEAKETMVGAPVAEPAAAPIPPVAPTPRPRFVRESAISPVLWTTWAMRGAAALLLVGLVGILVKNLYSDYLLQEAAEQDYSQVMASLKSGTDSDHLVAIQKFLGEYPNSPRVASLKDKAGALQATISRMETAQADLKSLKARSAEMSGDLESLREEFRTLLTKHQDTALAERIKAELRGLDVRITRRSEEMFASLEQQAAEFLADGRWGAAADVYKSFIAAHADQDQAARATEKLASVLRAAFDDYDKLITRSNALLEQGKYADASHLFQANISRFAGTLPYYQAQLKLLGIELLARGATDAKEDIKLRKLREECFQMALKADDLVKIRRYTDARKEYDKILVKLAAPELVGLREVFSARAKDVLAEARLFLKLVETINGKALKPDTYALSADFTGNIESANDQAIDVRFTKGFTRVAWLSLKPREMLEFYNRLKPQGDDLYTVAVYCYQNHLDKEAAKLLNQLAQAEPARKETIDRCVAQARGIEVPQGGFVFHRAGWLTPDELKYSQLDDQVDSIVAHLGRTEDKEVAKAFAEYQQLYANGDLRSEFREGAKQRVLTAFLDQREAAGKRLAKLPSMLKHDHLKKLKEELNTRRKAALELIYNEQVYTYDQAKNDHGEKAQPDVNKLVGAVRDLWEKPMDLVVNLDKSVQKLIEDIKSGDKYVAELGGKALADDESEYAALLAGINQAIDIRSITLDSGERQILEHNRRVYAFNALIEEGMTQDELRQNEVNNQYREMMGRKVLEAHKLLGQAARKHSEWMVNTGTFSHDEDTAARRTPGDRANQEGYSGPCGENICMGAGDPRTAFEMWYNSSGHHRNMLSDGWNQLGVGRAGMHWTQNFGNSSPQATKVSTDGQNGGGKGGKDGGKDGGKGGSGTAPGSKSGGSGGNQPPGGSSGGASGGG